MAKLTLSVNHRVIFRAKRYAKAHGVSVSQIVEKYLDEVAQRDTSQESLPVLTALRGSLKGAHPSIYKKHLEEKYL